MATMDDTFMDALVTLLLDEGEHAVIAVIGRHVRLAPQVALPQFDGTPADALAYARGLFEVGFAAHGRSVLTQVVQSARRPMRQPRARAA